MSELVTQYGGILSVKILDGSVIKFLKIGDNAVLPLGLAVSSMDRVAAIFQVANAGTSVYFYDNTLTSNNLVVFHWDTDFGENICSSFALTRLTFTSTALNIVLTINKVYTSPAYGVYSVNSIVTYTNITGTAVANTVYKDLGTTCTTNG